MSVRVMSLVWSWSLPATEKLVALKLADCADDAGRNAWPAVATIATDCGLTRRGAQKLLRRLEERGCIAPEAEQHTRRGTVAYRVLLNAVVEPEPASDGPSYEGANDVRGGEPCSQGGRTTFAEGANHVRGGGEPRSPDPSVIRQGSISEHNARAREVNGRRPHPLDDAMPRLLISAASLAQFDHLWHAYPRKDARLAAMRAWQEIAPSLELGAAIVAHVQQRIAAGWARDNPVKFLPQLRTFLEERRWTEAYAPAQTSARGSPPTPDGVLVMRSCPAGCGRVQEGRTKNGENVYEPCECTKESG